MARGSVDRHICNRTRAGNLSDGCPGFQTVTVKHFQCCCWVWKTASVWRERPLPSILFQQRKTMLFHGVTSFLEILWVDNSPPRKQQRASDEKAGSSSTVTFNTHGHRQRQTDRRAHPTCWLRTSLETLFQNHQVKTPLCKYILTCFTVLCVTIQTIWKQLGCSSPEGWC